MDYVQEAFYGIRNWNYIGCDCTYHYWSNFAQRVYDVVDRLETWKMDIMNRNVASELGRIKQLNLSGETQDKFESWKARWEQIIAKELPDIEEYLLDAEEAADRYRFSNSKKNIAACRADHAND